MANTDILVACPTCGHRSTAPVDYAGRRARCQCGATIVIPTVQPQPDEPQRDSMTTMIVVMSSVVAVGMIAAVGYFTLGTQSTSTNNVSSNAPAAAAPSPQQSAHELTSQRAAPQLNQQETSPAPPPTPPNLPPPTVEVAVLIKALHDPDRNVVCDAAKALGEMGPAAIAAIPALVELATYEEQGTYARYPTLDAADAIMEISPEAAVPHLIPAVKTTEGRYWAANLLGRMGPTAAPAVPALVEALRAVQFAQSDEERSGCAQAAAALASSGPRGLSALIGQMTHDSDEVRELAVWATPRGAAGKPAVDALVDRLRDDNADIRGLAAIALGQIGPDAENAELFLRDALKRETNGFVRMNLAGALQEIAPDGGDDG